jgi:AbiV family abortive infection protein
MRPRAISALNAYPEDRFLEEIGRGLHLVAKHASLLCDGADCLAESGQGRAMRVMNLIAAEEAAKYLVLLDAVRCPAQPPHRRARQLKYFNRHIPKGIYSAITHTRPARFGDLLTFIRHLRTSLYLDGPHGSEWIFRNEVRSQREEALYVDYVETEAGHRWSVPHPVFDDPITTRMHVTPKVVQLVKAMEATGFHEVSSLRVIASNWRDFDPAPDTSYTEMRDRILSTLKDVLRSRYPERASSETLRVIVDSWPFPLWNQDLSEIEIDRASLEGQREAFDHGY